MAKKIRFPLQMKDGFSVRTLEELREHFDLESVLGYFADGKLNTWLTDRYYDELAQKVDGLSADTPDLNAKLCEIFGVEYSSDADDTDFEVLQRRNEKLRVLREITDDQEILNNVDSVAFDQDELFDILDEAPDVIYLYGDKFSIPYAKGRITYIGVNNPEVLLEKSAKVYKENEIVFQNVRNDDLQTDEPEISAFYWTLQDAEDLILQGKYQEAFPIIKRLAENGDARAMYHMAQYYIDGFNTVRIDRDIRNEWLRKAFSLKEPLSMLLYASTVLQNNKSKGLFQISNVPNAPTKEQEKIYNEVFDNISQLAQVGDVFAQFELGFMYDRGLGTKENYNQAFRMYENAANNGLSIAQYILSVVYEGYRCGEYDNCYYHTYDYAHQDKDQAMIWAQKAAEQGNVRAQIHLGIKCYEEYDYEKATEWFEKAIEQGSITARRKQKQIERIKKIHEITDENIHYIAFGSSANAYNSIELSQNQLILQSAKNSFSLISGDVIGLIDTSIMSSGKSGILFTTEGFVHKAPLNNFVVVYDRIKSVEMRKNTLIIKISSQTSYEIYDSAMTHKLKNMILEILDLYSE